MKCVADIHYEVVRGSCTGEISGLRCMFCSFSVSKSSTNRPLSSTSGLGRYNRMRSKMVAHLHEHHRDQLRTVA